jgi:hypothetical protein
MGQSAEHSTGQRGLAFWPELSGPKLNRSVRTPRGVGNEPVEVPTCCLTVGKSGPDSGRINRGEASEAMCPARYEMHLRRRDQFDEVSGDLPPLAFRHPLGGFSTGSHRNPTSPTEPREMAQGSRLLISNPVSSGGVSNPPSMPCCIRGMRVPSRNFSQPSFEL